MGKVSILLHNCANCKARVIGPYRSHSGSNARTGQFDTARRSCKQLLTGNPVGELAREPVSGHLTSVFN